MGLVSRGATVIRKDGVVPFVIKSMKFAYLFALARLYSIGSGRTCPLCDFSGGRFRAAGDPPRREAACPKCGARERHRLLWLYIDRETEIERSEGRILYFAPRENIAGKLRKDSIVVTTDLLMEHVDVHSDITRLPFSESAFDAIICSHVLEHIPEDGAAIAELHRVLAPGGEALIMVPKDKTRETTYEDESVTSPEARRREFGQEDHVRWYGLDFPQRLEAAGFNVSVKTYGSEVGGDTADRYGLKVHDRVADDGRFEDIHHCTK